MRLRRQAPKCQRPLTRTRDDRICGPEEVRKSDLTLTECSWNTRKAPGYSVESEDVQRFMATLSDDLLICDSATPIYGEDDLYISLNPHGSHLHWKDPIRSDLVL